MFFQSFYFSFLPQKDPRSQHAIHITVASFFSSISLQLFFTSHIMNSGKLFHLPFSWSGMKRLLCLLLCASATERNICKRERCRMLLILPSLLSLPQFVLLSASFLALYPLFSFLLPDFPEPYPVWSQSAAFISFISVLEIMSLIASLAE